MKKGDKIGLLILLILIVNASANSLLSFHDPRNDSDSLFPWIVCIISFAAITFLLLPKEKEKDSKLSPLLFMIVFSICFAVAFFSDGLSQHPSFWLAGVIGLPLGFFICVTFVFIAKLRNKSIKIGPSLTRPFLIFFFIILVLSGLYLSEIQTRSSWSTFQPVARDIVYYAKNNSFNANFINNAGSEIKITDVFMNETFSNSVCSDITVNGLAPSSESPVTIPTSDSAYITGVCGGEKQRTEEFEMVIAISYASDKDSTGITRVENGIIRGMAE